MPDFSRPKICSLALAVIMLLSVKSPVVGHHRDGAIIESAFIPQLSGYSRSPSIFGKAGDTAN